MILTHLQGVNLRCFTQFELTPCSGVNFLIGENGSGKTSIIEAIHILGYGRSFRSRIRDGLIKNSENQLQIVASWLDTNHIPHQAGIQHNGNAWQARMDGENINQLGQFCAQFPVLSFEPGSHELISGNSDIRRRFIDWALFHVEPNFFLHWRRFNRALKQRNALLKTRPSSEDLAVWDFEFSESGEFIDKYRRQYLDLLTSHLKQLTQVFLPECGDLHIKYSSGWKDQQLSLLDSLRINRDRDLLSGFSTVGPHRADWAPVYNQQLTSDHFSRGQAKLIALACLLAQAELYSLEKNAWPVLCFDDLASELDQQHLEKVVMYLSKTTAQIWISGTELHALYESGFKTKKVFHVKHGNVAEMF